MHERRTGARCRFCRKGVTMNSKEFWIVRLADQGLFYASDIPYYEIRRDTDAWEFQGKTRTLVIINPDDNISLTRQGALRIASIIANGAPGYTRVHLDYDTLFRPRKLTPVKK